MSLLIFAATALYAEPGDFRLTGNERAVLMRVQVLYPSGMETVDKGTVLRAVLLHLKRQNTADNVSR